jgi:hypothetical protein
VAKSGKPLEMPGDPFGPLKGQFDALKSAMEKAESPFRPLIYAFDSMADKLKQTAAAATAPLKPLTTALDGLGNAWKAAVKPVADFRAALSSALEPLRAAKSAFDTLTAPVRMFLGLPAKIAGAVGDIAGKAGSMINGPSSQLQSFFGRVQGVVGHLVEKANPAAVLRFNLALDDLYATIGQMLTPVLNQFTVLARTLGSALNGMTTEGKKLIAGLAAGTIGMAVFAAGAYAVQAVLTGGIGPALGAIVGALGGMAFASGELQSAMKPVAEILGGLGNRIGEVMSKFAGSDAFGNLAVAFAEIAGVAIDLAASVLEYLMPAFSAAAELAKALAPAVLPLMGAIMMLNPVVGPVVIAVGLLAKGFELAAPYILAVTNMVVDFGKQMFNLGRQLLSIFGIDLGEFGAAPRSVSKDNTGAAVKSTSTTDVMSVLRAARESAFRMGTGGAKEDYAKQTATGVNTVATEAAAIRAQLEKLTPASIAAALATALSTATGNAVGSAASSVSSAAQTAGGVALRTNPITGPPVLAMDLFKYAVSKWG